MLEPQSVEEKSQTPSEIVLYPAYPNPFNPSAHLRFNIPVSDHVILDVYTLLGQKVAEVVNGYEPAGQHEFEFKADGFASGVYLFRLQTGTQTKTGTMILMK